MTESGNRQSPKEAHMEIRVFEVELIPLLGGQSAENGVGGTMRFVFQSCDGRAERG
jgi:hypothetical protein